MPLPQTYVLQSRFFDGRPMNLLMYEREEKIFGPEAAIVLLVDSPNALYHAALVTELLYLSDTAWPSTAHGCCHFKRVYVHYVDMRGEATGESVRSEAERTRRDVGEILEMVGSSETEQGQVLVIGQGFSAFYALTARQNRRVCGIVCVHPVLDPYAFYCQATTTKGDMVRPKDVLSALQLKRHFESPLAMSAASRAAASLLTTPSDIPLVVLTPFSSVPETLWPPSQRVWAHVVVLPTHGSSSNGSTTTATATRFSAYSFKTAKEVCRAVKTWIPTLLLTKPTKKIYV